MGQRKTLFMELSIFLISVGSYAEYSFQNIIRLNAQMLPKPRKHFNLTEVLCGMDYQMNNWKKTLPIR